jgi:tRNA-specific 2-thiouridylase
MNKERVRSIAAEVGLRTAKKPDSQDVCFIMAGDGGRGTFLGDRISLKPGRLVDAATGADVGTVDAVELVTVGQRKGMGGGTLDRRYAVDVDTANGVVTVGGAGDLLRTRVEIGQVTFTDQPVDSNTVVMIQVSAHGTPFAGTFMGDHIEFAEAQRRVAPGQSVVFYDGEKVLGGALARS